MTRFTKYILVAFVALLPAVASAKDNSTKQERNYIYNGNKQYNQKHFSEAEVLYRKALEIAPASEIAQFNLAAALIRQSGSADPNADNNPLAEAKTLLTGLAKGADDVSIAEKAFYNLGNLSFNQEQYAESIEHYKNALRRNPDNDKARENLRIAQLKLKEQQQNQDKNQDQQQDQNQQQQDQQQQDQQQNQDQSQQQDQNQQQQPQQQDKKDEQKQQQQQQQSISTDNAEKILKAMENAEAATRRRVEAEKTDERNSSRRNITKPW